MRRIAPFDPADMAELDVTAQQLRDHPREEQRQRASAILAGRGQAFTLRTADGNVLLCAGVARIDDSYGHAWAFMSRHAGPHMRWLTGRVRWYVDGLMADYRRIEMIVRADFPQARKWAAMLGFEEEGPLRCAAPDGGDMVRFARVNPAVFATREAA